MMSKKPYRKSTVGHYIVRMRRIKPLDELVHDNLDAHIADYETGANSAINHSSHNVYSCALRHFKVYRYPTINGDPFANGVLRFEDQSVAGEFRSAYDKHCRSESGRYEEIGYWMQDRWVLLW